MSFETLSAIGVVGALAIVIAVPRIIAWRRTKRLVRLLEDPRYTHAIDLFSHHWSADSCFQHAVDYLIGQGVAPQTARSDLTRMLGAVATMEWTTWGIQDGRSNRVVDSNVRPTRGRASRGSSSPATATVGFAMRPK
jgi:hypothetical protein